MAIPRIFLDKQTGKIRTALFSNGIEELFDVFSGKLKLLREVIIAYVTAGRVLDYSTKVGPLGVIDQSPEGNDATLYSGRGATLDAGSNTITYATGYSSAERTATVWMRVDGLGARTLNGATGTFTFTPTATGIWEELSDTQTVSGDLSWTAGSDCDIGDLTCADEHWTHDDWSNPTGDTSNGKTIVDSGPNDAHGTCTGCAGFTGEGIDPEVAGIVGYDDKMYFDGVDDSIMLPAQIDYGTSDFSITIDAFVGDVTNVIILGGGSSATRWALRLVDANTWDLREGLTATVRSATFDSPLVANSYVEFNLTRAGDVVTMSVNGAAQVDTATITSGVSGTIGWSSIGSDGAGSTQFYSGVITSISDSLGTTWDGTITDATNQGWTVNGISVGQKRATIPQTADRNWNKYQWFNGVDTSATFTPLNLVGDFTITLKALIPRGASGFLRGTGSVSAFRFLGGTSNQLYYRINNVASNFNFSTWPSTSEVLSVVLSRTSGVASCVVNGIASTNTVTDASDFSVEGIISHFAQEPDGIFWDINIDNQVAYTGLGNDPWADTIGSNDGTEVGTFTRELVSASNANDQIDAYGTPILEPRLNNQQLNLFGEGEHSRTADSDSLDVTTAATWELWGDFYGAVSVDEDLIAKYDTPDVAGSSFLIYKNDLSNADDITCITVDTTARVSTISGLLSGVSQIVIIFDSGVLTAYQNGLPLTVSGDTATAINAGNKTLKIGANEASGVPSRFASGKIGSAKLYNVALTADEVLKNFNAQKSKYSL